MWAESCRHKIKQMQEVWLGEGGHMVHGGQSCRGRRDRMLVPWSAMIGSWGIFLRTDGEHRLIITGRAMIGLAVWNDPFSSHRRMVERRRKGSKTGDDSSNPAQGRFLWGHLKQ